jgi:hypothetical protein
MIMPKRFADTEAAISKGLENIASNAAIKLIEAWESELEQADFTGAKSIAGDLERLKKALGKDSPDADNIYKLLAKLGQATVKAADKADGATADKVRSLGEALSNYDSADSAARMTEKA